jgi:hypothetical protein
MRSPLLDGNRPPYPDMSRWVAGFRCGAIAYDPVSHQYGWSFNCQWIVQAENSAWSALGSERSQQARIIEVRQGAYLALAIDGEHVGASYAPGGKQAADFAIDWCRADGGTNPRVVLCFSTNNGARWI